MRPFTHSCYFMDHIKANIRTIHFVEGVDIRHSAGNSVGCQGGKAVTMLLKKVVAVLSNMLKDDFLALWERETNQRADEVLFSEGRSSKTFKSPKDESSQNWSIRKAFLMAVRCPGRSSFVHRRPKPSVICVPICTLNQGMLFGCSVVFSRRSTCRLCQPSKVA